MMPLRYNPAVHRIHGTAYGRFLQEELRDPLIVTYRHEANGNWVVAAWVDGSKQKLLELAILGKTPTGTRDITESLKTLKVDNPKGMRQRHEDRNALMCMEGRWDKEMNADQEVMADARDYVQKYASSQLVGGSRHVRNPGIVTPAK